MLDSLHSLHSLPEEYSRQAQGMMMNPALNHGIHCHVAQSNSALLGLQPDWLNMTMPVRQAYADTSCWRRPSNPSLISSSSRHGS